MQVVTQVSVKCTWSNALVLEWDGLFLLPFFISKPLAQGDPMSPTTANRELDSIMNELLGFDLEVRSGAPFHFISTLAVTLCLVVPQLCQQGAVYTSSMVLLYNA